MPIRKIKKEEFNNLMEVMNTSFSFVTSEAKFEHILPKLYFKDNNKMVHYGYFIDNKLVSSIGLYEMELVKDNKKLNIACVGAVSTLPEYRNKGYFSKVMKELLNNVSHYDLLFLSGKRERYNRFNFENAGKQLHYSISKKASFNLDLKVIKMDKNDLNVIKACLDLYNLNKLHMNRTINDFYTCLLSWNNLPYVVYYQNKLIGYFAISNNEVAELCYLDNYLDLMHEAILLNNDKVFITTSSDKFNTLKDKVDKLYISQDYMFNIINETNVANFFNIDIKDNLSWKEKTIKILENIYIFPCDAG